MMQERTGGGIDGDFLAMATDAQAIERLDRRLCLALGGAKGCEVVVADQISRPLMHGVGIESDLHRPDVTAIERRRAAPVDEAIKIVPRGRIEAGVEFRRRRFRAQDSDRRRA